MGHNATWQLAQGFGLFTKGTFTFASVFLDTKPWVRTSYHNPGGQGHDKGLQGIICAQAHVTALVVRYFMPLIACRGAGPCYV